MLQTESSAEASKVRTKHSSSSGKFVSLPTMSGRLGGRYPGIRLHGAVASQESRVTQNLIVLHQMSSRLRTRAKV